MNNESDSNINALKLIPVIAIDFYSSKISMFAFTNKVCVMLILINGVCHYYSRTNQAIWIKGLTSGNIHFVQKVNIDWFNNSLIT